MRKVFTWPVPVESCESSRRIFGKGRVAFFFFFFVTPLGRSDTLV